MSARAEEYQALGDRVFYWSHYSPRHKSDLGSTAVATGEGLLVIDPSALAPAAWDELLAARPLAAIFLTNGNHVREAMSLHEEHGAPVYVPAELRGEIEGLEHATLLHDGEVRHGLRAIAIPGAGLGETAYHRAAEGLLVIGDAIIHVDPVRGPELLPDKYCADPARSRASLKRLLDFEFQTLTFAHGAPLVTRARERLAALLGA